MITKVKKTCRVCGKGGTVLRSGFCVPSCEDAAALLPKVPKVANGAYAPDTDQWSMFLRLLSERGPFSEVSGEKLITDTTHKFFVNQFSHTLPKGTYPELKMDERNIVLMTKREHDLWTDSKDTIRNQPQWQQVFVMELVLQREANERYKMKMPRP
jgi:hypothetical protein